MILVGAHHLYLKNLIQSLLSWLRYYKSITDASCCSCHCNSTPNMTRAHHHITITSQPITRLFHKIQRPPKTDLPPNDGLHHVLGSIRRSRSHVLPTLRLETCRLPRGMSRIGSTRKQPRGTTNYQFIAKGVTWRQCSQHHQRLPHRSLVTNVSGFITRFCTV